MIVGISTACFFPDIYTEQAVVEIGKMHISDVEVFFSSLSEYRIPFVKEVKKRADDNGIDIYSIHALSLQFEPQLFSKHARARQDSMDIYKQVLEAGAVLGAKVYVFHGPAHVKFSRTLLLNYEYIGQHVTMLADMAQQYGIKLAWETVHWCWYRSPEFPIMLSPYLGTDNLYYTLDIKQAAQSGHNPIDYIANMSDRLVNVHLCDYQYDQNRGIIPKLPFAGEMDFDALKQALGETGYSGAVMLEVYRSNYSDTDELENNYQKTRHFFLQ